MQPSAGQDSLTSVHIRFNLKNWIICGALSLYKRTKILACRFYKDAHTVDFSEHHTNSWQHKDYVTHIRYCKYSLQWRHNFDKSCMSYFHKFRISERLKITPNKQLSWGGGGGIRHCTKYKKRRLGLYRAEFHAPLWPKGWDNLSTDHPIAAPCAWHAWHVARDTCQACQLRHATRMSVRHSLALAIP